MNEKVNQLMAIHMPIFSTAALGAIKEISN
jgi:hypothetical protein